MGKAQIVLVVGGVLTIVIGLVLFSTVLNTATTSGSSTEIGSFTGAQDVNDLVPLVYISVIVVLAVSMIGLGAGGAAGFGPVSRRRGRKTR